MYSSYQDIFRKDSDLNSPPTAPSCKPTTPLTHHSRTVEMPHVPCVYSSSSTGAFTGPVRMVGVVSTIASRGMRRSGSPRGHLRVTTRPYLLLLLPTGRCFHTLKDLIPMPGRASGLKSVFVRHITASLLRSEVFPPWNSGVRVCSKAIKSRS